ncbi:hypothetical protein ILUMI_01365 [Ignelater luminosus]|uniref:Intraflagellar transport protein 46 homolog n=1 Tax=Ignelater luminosus TaxID=2038154 RepID=A0A8K0GHI0_IGNLU|nr:hypothetical protein ILUMI_01365 [Ignelater luminosus]
MQRKLEDDEDSFSLNEVENRSFDVDESAAGEHLENVPTLSMSSHPPSKHYPFSRRATQNLLDIDSDDDGQIIKDINPARFISNSPESPTRYPESYEEPVLSRQSSTKAPSAGPSNRQSATRIKSPRLREKQERMSSVSDSDESDEMGITKKKKSSIPGEYDPAQYQHLEVNEDIKEIFQYIVKYIPQQLNLDFKFKPFIPDFIPAVGDIDAFLKVMPPERTLLGEVFNVADSQLGLAVLDEPAANQSDPALLNLQLRAASISVSHSNQMMVVKKVENVEKNSKTIEKWIKDVSELHRNKAAAVVRYTNPMPDLDDLLQEWPEKFENAVKLHDIPSPKFCGTLSQYVDTLCAVFDIPIYKNKIQSLHVLFCLYAAIKNSQLYRAANTFDGKENSDTNLINKPDHLVLE